MPGRGWFNDRPEHRAAALGIKTRKGDNPFATPSIKMNFRAPNTMSFDIAQAYNRQAGLPTYTRTPAQTVDVARARRIALAYDALPVIDSSSETKLAYDAFASEVLVQFEFLSEFIDIEFTSGDPYPNSEAMLKDVEENKRLRVYSGGEPHPYLSADENNKFRAVHDFFGHTVNGFQFGPKGEEGAWVSHSKMFSRLAQRAMTTETRGQNSYYNYYPSNETRPPSARKFAIQKAALLPEEFWPQGAK